MTLALILEQAAQTLGRDRRAAYRQLLADLLRHGGDLIEQKHITLRELVATAMLIDEHLGEQQTELNPLDELARQVREAGEEVMPVGERSG